MNHSKLEVADDVVVAGSSNMDARSWQDNNENIFIIHDKALADAVWARFEDDKRHSVGITPEVLKQRDKGLVGAINVWLSDFLRGRWIGELL
jgi:phosphatidylserine/phosphatidylglycerophosphate/cardiolipin synthase-like enzyme